MIEEAIKKGLRFKSWAVRSYTALASPTRRIYDLRYGAGSSTTLSASHCAMLMGEPNRRSFTYNVGHPHGARQRRLRAHIHSITMSTCSRYGPPLKLISPPPQCARPALEPPPADLVVLPGRDADYPTKEMQALIQDIERLHSFGGAQGRAPLVDLVQDTVWWRRLLYFVSLILVLAAVA